MKKRSALIILALLVVLSSLVVRAAEEHLLPLQGTARINGGLLSVGNLDILIYDAASGGNLVYNSSTDFHGVIRNGRYDILIGNGSQPLSLRFGTKYYMDITMNSTDLDFNGSERQVFMSTVGNISLTTPLSTSSNDTDDALNISNGGSFFGGNISINGTVNITAATGDIRTAGRITSLNTDTDDAVNLTAGGLVAKGQISVENYTSAPAFTVNNGFNISGATSNLETNGSVIIKGLAPFVFNINNGFNVSGSNEALTTNGSISIQNPSLSPAFTLNNGFNISGTDESLRTNGTIRVEHTSTNAAINVTGGMAVIGTGQISSQFSVGNRGFTISDSGTIVTQAVINAGGEIIMRSSESVAFGINSGFNISGTNSALRTNGTMTILNADTDDALNISGGLIMGQGSPGSQFKIANLVISDLNIITTQPTITQNGHIIINSLNGPALSVNSGFNVSGTTGNLKTNGTMTILNTDVDDALNISGGYSANVGQNDFMQFIPGDANAIFTVKKVFNITPVGDMRIGSGASGTLTVLSTDTDDALNVSSGKGFFGANVTIGATGNADQHHLDINAPAGAAAANRCAYIALGNETGQLNYLFITNTSLRIASLPPINCDNSEGILVGSQTGT